MILGMTEMWVVLIASSAAPVWPLFRARAMRRSQQGTYGAHSKGLFSRSEQKGYKKTRETREMFMDERDLYSSDIGARKMGDSNASHENIVPNEGIMMTHNITIMHEDGKGTRASGEYV
jgi:hypothetical protein